MSGYIFGQSGHDVHRHAAGWSGVGPMAGPEFTGVPQVVNAGLALIPSRYRLHTAVGVVIGAVAFVVIATVVYAAIDFRHASTGHPAEVVQQDDDATVQPYVREPNLIVPATPDAVTR